MSPRDRITQAWHEFKSFFAMERRRRPRARSRSLAEVDLELLNALDALLQERSRSDPLLRRVERAAPAV